MARNTGPASLNVNPQGDDRNAAWVFFHSGSTSGYSTRFPVDREPIRLQAFGLTGTQYVEVEQITDAGGSQQYAPFAPLVGPVRLETDRTSVVLEWNGNYRLHLVGVGALGTVTVVGFKFSMTHEWMYSSIADGLRAINLQLEACCNTDTQVSTDPCNEIELRPNGIFAPEVHLENGTYTVVTGSGTCADPWHINVVGTPTGSANPLVVLDTVTVNLTLVSTLLNDTLSADVNISSRVRNRLFIDTDGLYAAPTFVEQGFGITITGIGTESDPYVVSANCCAAEGEIIGLVCVGPSVADPGLPGGFDTQPRQLDDVILPMTGATFGPCEKSIFVSVKSVQQNGGSGSPWTVDFSGITFRTLLYEELTPIATVAIVSGSLTQLIASTETKYIQCTLREQVPGTYDVTKNGWAAIQILAGSYIDLTDQIGNTKRLYIPSGSEGFVACENLSGPQSAYTDTYSILVRAVANFPRATVCYVPSTAVPGDIINGGVYTNLGNCDLATDPITCIDKRFAVRLSNFRQSDATDNGPYRVDWSNVVIVPTLQQTEGGVVSRLAPVTVSNGPGENIPGTSGMTFMAVDASQDGFYDATKDGFGSFTVAGGSFVLIADADGVVSAVYTMPGSEGSAACATDTDPQTLYEDRWNITGDGVIAPACGNPLNFHLHISPSATDPGAPGPGGGGSDIGDVAGSESSVEDDALQLLYVSVQNITGGLPPYSVDFTQLVFDFTAIHECDYVEVSGPPRVQYHGAVGSMANPIRTGVYAADLPYTTMQGLLSAAFDPTDNYIFWQGVRGSVTVRDSCSPQNTKTYYIPNSRSEGSTVGTTQLTANPNGSNFYIDASKYFGYNDCATGVGCPPNCPTLVAQACIVPSVAVPGDGGEVQLQNVSLTANSFAQAEKTLCVQISGFTGGTGGPYSVLFANDDFGAVFAGEVWNTEPALTARTANLSVNTVGPTTGLTFSSIVRICATLDCPNYDYANNGYAILKVRAGSYCQIDDGVNPPVKLYLPGGSEGLASCNGTPGPYQDRWDIGGNAAPPATPLTAVLYINPSVGDPDITTTQLLDTAQPSIACGGCLCANTAASGVEKTLNVRLKTIDGGNGGPYTVDLSGLVFQYNADTMACGPGNSPGTFSSIVTYSGGTGGSSDPIRTAVANLGEVEAALTGIATAYAPGCNYTFCYTVSGYITVSDATGSRTYWVPTDTYEGAVGGTQLTADPGGTPYYDCFFHHGTTCGEA